MVKGYEIKTTPLGIEYCCSDPCRNCQIGGQIDDAARKILQTMSKQNSGFTWHEGINGYYTLGDVVEGPTPEVLSCNPCGARYEIRYGLDANSIAGIICRTVQHYDHIGFLNTEGKRTL